MQNIYLIAFGTFGNPYGFRQSFIKLDNENVAKSIKTFDLNTNAIKLFHNSTIYCIRKETVNGLKSIAYSKYTFAKEQNSDRGGTFIGSSIFYTNKIVQENLTISKLNEFHKILVEKNIVNDTIKVNHSDDFLVELPSDFDKLSFNSKKFDEITNFTISNTNLVVYTRIKEEILQHHFKNSLELLNIYDAIYFTDSKEISDFTKSKGIYKTIAQTDFTIEINNLLIERKRKKEQSILDFEREFKSIKDDKNRTILELKNQIEQNERTHHENTRKLKDSKDYSNKIGQFYDDFISKTNNLINQLKQNNEKLDEIIQIHKNHKILFNNRISDLKKPNDIATIAKSIPKGNLNTENQIQEFEIKSFQRGQEGVEVKEKVKKIDKFKVITIILAFLLIVSWCFFLFVKINFEKKTEKNNKHLKILKKQDDNFEEIENVENLNPVSNSSLNENDYRIVAKYLKTNMKLEDVVNVIFSKNPTEIGDFYSGQEKNYSKKLLELNNQCFIEKDGIYFYNKDTLRQIPSYMK